MELVAQAKRLLGTIEMGPILASVIENAERHLHHCYGVMMLCIVVCFVFTSICDLGLNERGSGVHMEPHIREGAFPTREFVPREFVTFNSD